MGQKISLNYWLCFMFDLKVKYLSSAKESYWRSLLSDPELEETLRRQIRLRKSTLYALANRLTITKRSGWNKIWELLVFLFWIATGCSYRVVAQAFDMPVSSVFDILHRQRRLIIKLLPLIVKLPATEEVRISPRRDYIRKKLFNVVLTFFCNFYINLNARESPYLMQ